MGLHTIALKVADENIVSGSLVTVESNHFCIVKTRGAVLDIYDTGQYSITTPDKPIFGAFIQAAWGGQSPWQYEIIFVNRSKLLVHNEGIATTKEMAEVRYVADYYVHVDTKEMALELTTHMPFTGTVIDTNEIAAYAGPAIEQAINQIVQVTQLERINEKIDQIREGTKNSLTEFLAVYGIHLNDLRILITPADERMRELISMQALGLSAIEAVRYHLAYKMAEKGLAAAANAACGEPYYVVKGNDVTPIVNLPPDHTAR